MTELTRREALAVAGACACCAMAADFTEAAGPATKPAKSLALGKLSDYATAGLYTKFAAKPTLLIVARLEDRVVAMSATCTHKGCPVKVNADDKNALKCPCHKAEFSIEGTPTGGPAKTALPRFALAAAADGTITADLTKSFSESKWEDKAAFISAPKVTMPAAG